MVKEQKLAKGEKKYVGEFKYDEEYYDPIEICI